MANKNESVPVVEGVVYKVTTTADGGARITIDVGFDASWIVKELLLKKMSGDEIVKMVFIQE